MKKWIRRAGVLPFIGGINMFVWMLSTYPEDLKLLTVAQKMIMTNIIIFFVSSLFLFAYSITTWLDED